MSDQSFVRQTEPSDAPGPAPAGTVARRPAPANLSDDTRLAIDIRALVERGALDEAMNFKGPALVNVKLSLGSQRKAQEFRWHS